MTDRELMQQALEALELVTDLTSHDDEIYAAIDALRERLAQPEQEPVAWRWENKGEDKWLNKYTYLDNGGPDCPEDCEPLYTAPQPAVPERKPLTDEEIMNLCAAEWASHPIEVARVIEAAHGIRSNDAA